ncbi:MAG: DedA family protein [Holosporales bacterium]|jgi:membrane protein DedA with SNARE-associated domain
MTFWDEALAQLGYPQLFFLMVLENLFPPLPSEAIVPLAGMRVAGGELSFWGVVACATAGAVAGQTAWYLLARHWGKERLGAFLMRRRWLGITAKDLAKADSWFHRYQIIAVLLCRLVPGVRTIISIPAGLFAMPLWLFLLCSAVGSGVWVTILTLVGRSLGSQSAGILSAIESLGSGMIVFLMLLVGVFWWQRYRGRAGS